MMKRILLLTMALLALVVGQISATIYKVPEFYQTNNLPQLKDGDIIELTANVTGYIVLEIAGSNITVQSAGDNHYTLTKKDLSAIGIYQSVKLTLKNITVDGILIDGQHGVHDITLKTEGDVTVSSGIKANDNVQAGSKLTIDGDAWQKGDVVEFKGAGSYLAELNNLDVKISGGQPQFIYEGVFDNISAFQTTESVIITDSNPFFSAKGIALQAKNLTITGNSSPKFTSTNDGSALLLSGDALTINSSGNCFFTNNSSEYNTIQFEEDATLNVEDMNGILTVKNEVIQNDEDRNGNRAISSRGKLTITGTTGGDGKIVAIGADCVINGNELLIDAYAKIEVSLNENYINGGDIHLLSSDVENKINVQNAEITLKGSSHMVYCGMTMESGVLNLDGKILANLTIGENARLHVASGASTHLGIEGKTILNNGTIVNEGTLTFAHKLTNNGTIKNDGTLINNAMTVLNNYGVLNTSQNITNKGTINNYKPIEGDGKIVNEDKGVTNELWQTVNTTYHTITLTVAEGIHCEYASGSHTIADGQYFFLTFSPDYTSVTAEDILFLVDGKETEFRVSTDGRGGSYLLSSITSDHAITIALRQYPVTFPTIEGLTITAEKEAVYGEPFTFSISSETLDLSEMKVLVNGNELPSNALRTQSYTYTIDKVEGPLTITLEGIDTTGNTKIAESNIRMGVENGELRVESDYPIDVTVYTITGKSVASIRALHGSRNIILRSGIYVVRTGATATKVIIP